jgi:hypothetical protein
MCVRMFYNYYNYYYFYYYDRVEAWKSRRSLFAI